MKWYLIFINFILFSRCFQAQITDQNEFSAVYMDSIRGIKLFEKTEEILNKKMEEYSGDNKKEYKEFIKSSKKVLRYAYSHIFFHEEYLNYLNAIRDHILEGNPELAKEQIRPSLLLTPIANAVTFADGTVFVFAGILEILESEAELAMVMCHEFTHKAQCHLVKSVEKNAEKEKSKALNNEIKKANKSGIERVEKLSKIANQFEFEMSAFNREEELEADSIGLNYLSNSKYDLEKGIKGILNLRQQDTEQIDMETVLATEFNFLSNPFNSKWMHRTESMSDKMTKRLAQTLIDSFQSHPDIEYRYDKLKTRLKDLKTNGNEEFVISSPVFHSMKNNLRRHIVVGLIENKYISDAMYAILKFQSQGDTSIFYKTQMLKCINILHDRLDDHTLAKYVDTYNPFFPKEYNKLLTFIDNLRVDDLDKLSINYKLKHKL